MSRSPSDSFRCEGCGAAVPTDGIHWRSERILCAECNSAGPWIWLRLTPWSTVLPLLLGTLLLGGLLMSWLAGPTPAASSQPGEARPAEEPAGPGAQPAPARPAPGQTETAARPDITSRPTSTADPSAGPPAPVVPRRPLPTGRQLLVASEQGRLAVWDGTTWTVDERLPEALGAIQSGCVDRSGQLWLGAQGAVLQVGGDALRIEGAGSGVPPASVSTLYETAAGELWMGTWGAGIARRQGDRWQRLTRADGLAHDEANALAEDWNGKLWIGTDAGVSILDESGFVSHPAVEQMASLNVKAMSRDAADGVLLGCIGGVMAIDPSLAYRQVTTSSGLPQRTAQALLSDSTGRCWAGTWGGGVASMSLAEDSATAQAVLPAAGMVTALTEDGLGRVWAASATAGLFVLEDGAWQSLALPADFGVPRCVLAVTAEHAARLRDLDELDSAPRSGTAVAPGPTPPPGPPAHTDPVTEGVADTAREAASPVASLTIASDWNAAVHVHFIGGSFWLEPGSARTVECRPARYQVQLSPASGGRRTSTHPAFDGAVWRITPDPASDAFPHVQVQARQGSGDSDELVRIQLHNPTQAVLEVQFGETGPFVVLPPGALLDRLVPARSHVVGVSASDGRRSHHVAQARADRCWRFSRDPGLGIELAVTPAGAPVEREPRTRPDGGVDAVAWHDRPVGPLLSLDLGPSAGDAATFAAGGRVVVAGVDRETLRAWDVGSGDVLWTEPAPGGIIALGSTPDGDLLVVDRSGQRISTWDPLAGRLLGGVEQHLVSSQSLVLDHAGRFAAVEGFPGGVFRLDVERLTLDSVSMGSFEMSTVRSVTVGYDGRWIAAGDDQGRVRLVEVVAGGSSRTLSGPEGWVNELAFSPDGTQLAGVAGHYGGAGFQSLGRGATGRFVGGGVWLWAPTTEEVGGVRLGAHEAPARSVAFAPDGRRLLSGGHDGTARLWDVERRRQEQSFAAGGGAVVDVGFDPAGRLALALADDGSLVIHKLGGLP